jgi:hypothetical protein
MNNRIRGARSVLPNHNWIGPILWLLAVAFLALTIAILVETVPHKSGTRSSVAVAIVLLGRSGVASHRVPGVAIPLEAAGAAGHEAGATMIC